MLCFLVPCACLKDVVVAVVVVVRVVVMVYEATQKVS